MGPLQSISRVASNVVSAGPLKSISRLTVRAMSTITLGWRVPSLRRSACLSNLTRWMTPTQPSVLRALGSRGPTQGHLIVRRASSRTGSSSSGDEGNMSCTSTEDADQEYWSNQLQNLTGSKLENWREQMDCQYALGIKNSAGVGLYSFYEAAKRLNPKAVIVAQVGANLEAIGIDALLVAHYGGLSLKSTDEPRVLIPSVCLVGVMAALHREGLDVAVHLEAADPTEKKPLVRRPLLLVSTPFNPQLPPPQALGDQTGQQQQVASISFVAPPMIGIAASKRGYTLMVFQRDIVGVKVYEGLSFEALGAHLNALEACVPPVMVHESVQKMRHHNTGSLQSAIRDLLRRQENSGQRSYISDNPVEGFELEVRRRLNKDGAETPNIDVAYESYMADQGSDPMLLRPQPPYQSTLAQLGMLPSSNAPSLMVGGHVLMDDS